MQGLEANPPAISAAMAATQDQSLSALASKSILRLEAASLSDTKDSLPAVNTMHGSDARVAEAAAILAGARSQRTSALDFFPPQVDSISRTVLFEPYQPDSSLIWGLFGAAAEHKRDCSDKQENFSIAEEQLRHKRCAP